MFSTQFPTLSIMETFNLLILAPIMWERDPGQRISRKHLEQSLSGRAERER